MKTSTMLIGTLLLALGAGVVAVAQMHAGQAGHGGHGHAGPDGPMMVPQMVEWLVDNTLNDVGASDAQRAKVLAVKERVLAEAAQLHKDHDATHAEFKRQWDQDKMDAARLHALVGARMDEMARVLHGAVDGIVEVHDTLNPEQRRAVTAKIQALHGQQ